MNAQLLGTRLYILFVIAACFSATVAGSAYAEIQEPPSLQRFTSGGHVLGFDEAGYFASNGTYALRVRFEGASGSSGSVVGTSPGTGTSGATASAVPEFEGISYQDVWPGIGVEYDAPKGGIARSTWTVAPGADPKTIQLRYNRPVALTGNGSLQIGFETGTMTESAPIAWQDVDGRRQPVEVSFATTDNDLVGFAVGAYRSDLPLVIDPTLEWNTFLGGSGYDYGYAIAVDATGNVYVGGISDATWGSPVRAYTAALDAFAAKLDSAGNLVWNTFLGGSGIDIGTAIAVDASGNVYVGGYGSATWGSPVRAYTADYDAFAAKLDSSGNLLWNTFLGGSGFDRGWAIAVDASGNVYVGGYSDATWGSPVDAYTASLDAFAAKLDSAGNLVWNTFLGWTGMDFGTAIAVDATGNVYVGGYFDSSWDSGVEDAFAAKLDSSGNLLWETVLKGEDLGDVGSGSEIVRAIAVDASGNVYVGGYSNATWGSPVRAYSGGDDAFAAKLDSSGNLLWNTFLGGSGYAGAPGDVAYGIAVDASGNVYVGGYSNATWGSPERAYTASNDAFAAKLDSSGNLLWNTFLGGSGYDVAYGIAVDASGNVYVGGYSTATWGSPERAYTAGTDAFAAMISPQFCGNSVIDPGEDCDDGNTDDGDCCSSTCTFETAGSTCLDDDLCNGTETCDGAGTCDAGTALDCDDSNACTADSCDATLGCQNDPEPASTPCADGDLCNGNETCDGAGNCDAGAPLDCSDGDLCTQDSCDPVLGCQNPTEPATGCVDGWSKGMLLVKEAVAGKEKLIAKFIKGPEILATEFGNPSLVAGTAYTTCIYDDQGALVGRLEIDRAGYACGSKACWLDMGPRGFSYKDSEASADGVSQARLMAGPSGKSMILLKAANNSKKSQLDLPTGISLGLSNSTSATIQLVGSDAPACFSLTLGNVKKQEVHMFNAVK